MDEPHSVADVKSIAGVADRQAITELLQDECDLVTAADGELAWAQLQHTPIDAIVSDVLMPNLDGFSLTARVKSSASFSHVPVILLTADSRSARSLDRTRYDAIASKPVALEALLDLVSAALRPRLRSRPGNASVDEV